MSSILTIIFNAQVLLLEGKNLIITGNNGAGKTRFLNDLANNLKGNIHYNNKDLRNKIISEINFGIINFHPSLEFTEALLHKALKDRAFLSCSNLSDNLGMRSA